MAETATLAAKNATHAQRIGANTRFERLWMAVSASQPLAMCAMRETYCGHVSGLAHDHIQIEQIRLCMTINIRTRLDCLLP